MSSWQGLALAVRLAMVKRYRSRLLIAVAMVFSVGCSTTPIGRGDLLDFLKDGVSTREDIILHLGDPNAMYEHSRILTYRLSQDETGWFLRDNTKNWYGVLVNLVLVLDDQGVLKRHSRVQVRSP